MEDDQKKNQPRQDDSGGKRLILPAYGLAEEVLGGLSREGPGPEKENRGNALKPVRADRGAEEKHWQKFVTFFLEKEEYGLPISRVQEINRVGEITRVPNAPAHVRGVINLRGKIVPVIELKSRLKLGKSEINKDSRVVVVEHGPKLLGFLVDRVSQVLNLSSDEIETAPEEVDQGHENYIQGVGKLPDRMIILLNFEKIVSPETSHPA
jgi:purine-binding chemotaxis protein CheW